MDSLSISNETIPVDSPASIHSLFHCPKCSRIMIEESLYCRNCKMTWFIFGTKGKWKQVG